MKLVIKVITHKKVSRLRCASGPLFYYIATVCRSYTLQKMRVSFGYSLKFSSELKNETTRTRPSELDKWNMGATE